MGVGIGLGCAEFPFSGAAAYWRWIDMCEAGGVDSIWQTDRIVGHQPFLESMTTMAALAGARDADAILARIAEYVDAGVSKFILRPLGGDDETLLAQTRQLIEQVLPRAETRWPKRPKTSDK